MKKGSVIMKELSKRTKTFTDSVIRRMTRIAKRCLGQETIEIHESRFRFQ